MPLSVRVTDEDIQAFYDENQQMVDSFHAVNGTVMFDDVNLSAFFLKELVSIESRTYDTKFKKLKYAELLPVDTSDDPGAKHVAYQKYTKRGRAKIISNYSQSSPRVDVFGEEIYVKVYQIGSSFGYSRDEIRSSKLAGKSLDMKRAESAKLAIEQEFERLAWSGDSDYHISSMLDYPGINEYVTPDGISGDPEFSNKTPLEILEDLNGLVSTVISITNGVEEPDTLLLPIDQYELIKNTPVTELAQASILRWFLENNVHIKRVDWLPDLHGAGAGGSDRMICYPLDRNNLAFKIPLPYTQLPPTQEGYGFEVLTEAKCAGTVIYYPLSVSFSDNI